MGLFWEVMKHVGVAVSRWKELGFCPLWKLQRNQVGIFLSFVFYVLPIKTMSGLLSPDSLSSKKMCYPTEGSFYRLSWILFTFKNIYSKIWMMKFIINNSNHHSESFTLLHFTKSNMSATRYESSDLRLYQHPKLNSCLQQD